MIKKIMTTAVFLNDEKMATPRINYRESRQRLFHKESKNQKQRTNITLAKLCRVLEYLLLQLFISPKGGPTFLGFFYTGIIYRE
jgi:hypothetical protein